MSRFRTENQIGTFQSDKNYRQKKTHFLGQLLSLKIIHILLSLDEIFKTLILFSVMKHTHLAAFFIYTFLLVFFYLLIFR